MSSQMICFFLNNVIDIYNYADDNCISDAEKNALQIKIILDLFAKKSLAAQPTKFQIMLLCRNDKNVE